MQLTRNIQAILTTSSRWSFPTNFTPLEFAIQVHFMRPRDTEIRRGYTFLALGQRYVWTIILSSRYELITDLVHDFNEIELIELDGISAVDVGSSPFKWETRPDKLNP